MARREYRIVGINGPEQGVYTSVKEARKALRWHDQREQVVADFAEVLGVEPEQSDLYWIESREVEPWNFYGD